MSETVKARKHTTHATHFLHRTNHTAYFPHSFLIVSSSIRHGKKKHASKLKLAINKHFIFNDTRQMQQDTPKCIANAKQMHSKCKAGAKQTQTDSQVRTATMHVAFESQDHERIKAATTQIVFAYFVCFFFCVRAIWSTYIFFFGADDLNTGHHVADVAGSTNFAITRRSNTRSVDTWNTRSGDTWNTRSGDTRNVVVRRT